MSEHEHASEGRQKTPPRLATRDLVNQLQADLLSGALPPGQKLKIEELKLRYNCGATPLREALSQLSADYLVQKFENRGFRAAPLTEEEFRELLMTRIWLEERALRESIAHGDRAWEDEVVLAHHHLSATPRSLDPARYDRNPKWEEAHKRFHMAILSACGSPSFMRFCSQIYDRSTRYRHAAAQLGKSRRNVASEHNEIKELVIRRDADAAVGSLIEHYKKTGDYSLHLSD